MAKTKIQIVEDEVITAKGLKASMENSGYLITSLVDTGEEAIERAGEDRPDLILMDIVLKGDMDGIDAAKIILSRYDIPIIYLTAYTDDKVLERAKTTQPFGYLIKPFQPRELDIAIELAMYRHKTEIERKKAEEERKKLVTELQEALSNVKALSGLLPICASCNKIRDDKGYWNKIETYIKDHSEAEFTHGICPDCQKKHYPDLFK